MELKIQSAQTCIECGKSIDPVKLGTIIEEAERTQKELELRMQQSEMEKTVTYLKRVISESRKVGIENR